ncbi:MAG: amidohydrolase [Chloroflexi bacterium]|nr:amidohydrolase [Chloroflexota bacterium]MCI0575239.1 amidohydrolase [Chloroflexota bacterium]MCI0648840.1 amidohydrolase [Chloroflexota bacterium]MCI0726595.1 amidohydrolase [Chloroflexota bacterium]
MLDKARSLADELVRLRRDIHQHPELGFREFRTAALVADTLAEIGLEVKTGVGGTGVVGQLGSGPGPTIAIRADMDALPIQEKNDTPYRSQNDGVMHACGHDAHTAILLGAAHLLKQSFLEGNWQGNVRFLFQPSEEAFGEDGISGATAMIRDEALAGVDAVIALHVFSDQPAGQIYFQDGFSLAAVDSFQAWIRATGGHGAYPHYTRDPLFILGPVLTALYGIPSRRINPLRPSVVSLGQIHAGTASNVIPGEVYLTGTLRSFEPAVREQLWVEVENAFKISQAMGGSYEFQLIKGYPSMHNDPRVNDWIQAAAGDLLGAESVHETELGMGAEDFAYMTQLAPGAMFILGASIGDGVLRNHHTDTFNIDESVLPTGAAVLAETARRFVTGKLERAQE